VRRIAIQYVDPRRYDAVYIDWTLGNFCNYSCSYCPDELHDNSHPMADIELVRGFTKRLFDHYKNKLGKKYFIFNLMGGEPTLWKSIEPFVIWVKEYSQMLGVISIVEILSNGSRTLRWWGDYVRYFDIVKITHHTEFADPQHTAKVADLVADNGINAGVQVTMIPDRWEDCIKHLSIISQSRHQFRIDVKPLRVGFGSKLYDYTPEQLAIFQQPYRKADINPGRRDTINLQGKSLFDNGEEQIIRYQDLITKRENSWVGWQCWAGIDIINIKPDGTVRLGGACGMKDDLMYNKLITDPALEFRTDPIICTQQWCSCGPDIETRKNYVRQ
jgi:hypothetical protein